MRRKIGIVLAWAAATALSIFIATAAVGAVRGRVTEPPPAIAAPADVTTTTTDTPSSTTTAPASSSTTSTTAPIGSTTSTTAAPADTTSTTVTTTQPVPATEIKTYTTIGGAVTIEVSPSQLRLLGATPSSGFTVSEKELSSTRIEIEFRSADHESKFRASLEHGELDTEIDEEGDEGD